MDTTITMRVRASRVGAMLGFDPRCTPLALYHEMRGSLPPVEDNEVLKEGRYFEDAIGKIAAEKFGFTVLDEGRDQMVDGALSGHVDRIFSEDGKVGVLEIKNTLFGGAGQEWGESESDNVPEHYYFQVMAYQGMLRNSGFVSLADYAILAARLHGGTRKFVIRWDAEVYAKIQQEAAAFVQRVIEGNPPTPQDEADQRMRWLVTAKKAVEGNSDFVAWCKGVSERKAQIKQLESEVSELQTLILGYAQDAEEVRIDGQVIATLAANRKFNAQRFTIEQPELVAKFQTLDTSRLSKEARSIYESYMEKPTDPLKQTRIIRIKGEKP
jgi:predicted phage-related endonuclease